MTHFNLDLSYIRQHQRAILLKTAEYQDAATVPGGILVEATIGASRPEIFPQRNFTNRIWRFKNDRFHLNVLSFTLLPVLRETRLLYRCEYFRWWQLLKYSEAEKEFSSVGLRKRFRVFWISLKFIVVWVSAWVTLVGGWWLEVMTPETFFFILKGMKHSKFLKNT